MALNGNSYYYIYTFNPSTKTFTSKAYNSIYPYNQSYLKRAKFFTENDIYMAGHLERIHNEAGLSLQFSTQQLFIMRMNTINTCLQHSYI